MYSNDEQNLEALLKQAAMKPAYRLQFYQELMQSKLYVLGKVSEDETKNTDKKLSLVYWKDSNDKPIIPVFSSLAQLKKVTKNKGDYIGLDAKVLFQSAIGQTLILNPMSDYSKELLPAEVQALLDGSMFETLNPVTMKKGQDIAIGQPQTYPQALIDQLSLLFPKDKNLDSAYLAQIYNDDTDDEPHLLIAIKGNGDFSSIISDAGFVVQSLGGGNNYVDFYIINERNEISKYFEEIVPFYCKS